MSHLNELIGAGGGGGKGGSGGGGSFTNKPDNLRSDDSFEVLLGLGSGRWKGLVNGLRSLYINDVPFENEDGSSNFKDITALFANGDPTQEQLVNFKLGGGGGITTVNTAITNPNTNGTPGLWVSGATTTSGADFVDLRFVVNALSHQTPKGIFESKIRLEVNMRPQGSATWINPLLPIEPVPVVGGAPEETASPVPITYDPENGSYTGTVGEGTYTVYNPRSYAESNMLAQADRPEEGAMRGALFGLGDYIWRGSRSTQSDNGYFVINGKTTSPFVKELRIVVPTTGNYANKTWEVRVRMLEQDHQYTNANTENQTETTRNIIFESITAVTKQQFGSAEEWRGLVWMQIGGKASDQLNGFPALKGIYDTKEVKVPPEGVFNPEARTYTGALWDGTYSIAYTNDPAWCFKDLIEDPTSGVAAISPGATLDKWDALECSKYCSEQVPDGRGGTHPRFSMNLRCEQSMDAEELIRYMAGAFSALAVDTGNGKWRLKMDKPETPVATFTIDNIMGDFQYSHTDMDTRFNDVTMTFLNEDILYQEDRLRVYDQANIDLYGRKPTTLVAVGASHRQEALRRGVLRLRSSLNETKIVKFITNRQGRYLEPLQTILVADQSLGYSAPTGSGVLEDFDPYNNRTTSRIEAMNEARTQITLGRSIRLEPTVTYKIKLTVPNPNYNPDIATQPSDPTWKLPTIAIERTLTNTTAQRGDVTELYLDSALPADVPINAVIALDAPGLPSLPVQYRILEVSPSEDEEVSISAIIVDSGKYAAADNATTTDITTEQQTGLMGPPPSPGVPTWGMFTLTTFPNEAVTQRLLSVNWTRPSSMFLEGYKVEYRINNGAWTIAQALTNMELFEIVDPSPGLWDWRITAKNRKGVWSAPLIGSIEILAIGADSYLHTYGPFVNRPSTNLTEGQLYTSMSPLPVKTYRWNGTAWEVVASVGATAGTDLYNTAGTVLTQEQVVTLEGTAAGIINQAPTATNSDFAAVTGTTRPEDNATYTKNQQAWVANYPYKVGDFVQYANSSWIAVDNHTSNASYPPGNATNTQFKILAQAGVRTEFQYIRSNATPATPSGDNPAGWSTIQPTTPLDQAVWRISGSKNTLNQLQGVWSTPVKITTSTPRGPYTTNTLYYTTDVVTYNGGSYHALENNFQNQAPSGTAQANTYWGVTAAPGSQASTGSQTLTLTLSAGAVGSTTNLRTLADAGGYTGGDLTLTVNVTGTYRGPSGGYAIRTGTFPTNKTIAITINVNSGAVVDGGGGAGGTGGTYIEGTWSGPGFNGSSGSDAFFIEHNISGGLIVNSGATVRAGSGGFAGGSAANAGGGGPLNDYWSGGNGGSGGFPNGNGGGGGQGTLVDNEGMIVQYEPTYDGAAGSTGTTAMTPAANNSATAGYAVRKNGFTCTVSGTGTINGTVG